VINLLDYNLDLFREARQLGAPPPRVHDTSLHDNSIHETMHTDAGLDAHLGF
jgi:hypothetical protein